ncbi:hypothetical protein BV898_17058 [Hypsibius exemplaris]|uniref:G-protein coupled receptors family 1 profile domain-containing protein n=1 Tax=Hypsibius exemplaris TaxID=2072580 RepID=A0A9X6RM30_HYPEX|nr:hypothetical protein BV898_17058 [Hypsibius exemplaris]
MSNYSFSNTSALNNSTLYNVSSVERSSLRVWFATFLAFSIVGIFTNGLLFLVIIRSQTLGSGAGVLILHVITNCFITCAVHNPIHCILIYGDHVWFARPRDICKYVHFLLGLTQFANNWAEASLAVNRLVAMIFPFAYKTWSTRKVGGKFYATEKGQCTIQIFGKLGGILTVVAIYVAYGIVGVIAVVVFLVMYVRSFRGHHGDSVQRPGPRQVIVHQRRRIVTKMLLISFLFDVMCMYVMCTIPQPMILASLPAIYADNPLLRLWLRSCLVLQFPTTPVILFACNDDYRSHLWRWMRSMKTCFRLKGSNQRVTPKDPTLSGINDGTGY